MPEDQIVVAEEKTVIGIVSEDYPVITQEDLTIVEVVEEQNPDIISIAEQGIPGADGDKTFVHTQIRALSIWDIQHNLNKYPSVSIVDSGNSEVVGEVDYISINNVRVTFTAEFGGKAYLN